VPTDEELSADGAPFTNEPETDPTVPENREWVAAAVRTPPIEPVGVDDSLLRMEERLDAARGGQRSWVAVPPEDRRHMLRNVATELGRRRSDLVSAMVHEGRKTFAQADPEICEAIDFARYYADRVLDLEADGAVFEPFGVVAVIPPWNFPVAIPAGGVLASLAAGNSVIFKPAPETPRCAEIVAECCWSAGVPGDVLQYVRAPENEVGRRLVTGTDAVILTGSIETADLFRSWKPDIRLFAETSGKNAMIITPNADIDLAVADLVASAFGHAGQKCSAASLAICVGDVYESDRFRRQLRDAVESLAVGDSTELPTTVNGLIGPPGDALRRALTTLEPGEEWLVEPYRIGDDDRLWFPGVRLGVQPGSWYHRTECFGPMLGLIRAGTLDDAIAIQNSSQFGLTGGIQSLDPVEIDEWVDRVEVGNAYVNRSITGAIVQRQPFGGWKRSCVGPGAKAGGPNYVRQLGRWVPVSQPSSSDTATWLDSAIEDDERWWADEYAREHDPTGLFCESNRFRYRPVPRAGLRVARGVPTAYVDRVRAAVRRCGVELVESWEADEDEAAFTARIGRLGTDRVRVLGTVGTALRSAADAAGVHLADDPVTRSGRVELLHYLREQAVSETRHRFGNLVVRR
jgi:RHH-type proline utilization regulon transcriptional repressor/proline dehydrogenase/delta 1-pyrroline-5-carboxylate dehydrogenase